MFSLLFCFNYSLKRVIKIRLVIFMLNIKRERERGGELYDDVDIVIAEKLRLCNVEQKIRIKGIKVFLTDFM